jgi:hypothetical protein
MRQNKLLKQTQGEEHYILLTPSDSIFRRPRMVLGADSKDPRSDVFPMSDNKSKNINRNPEVSQSLIIGQAVVRIV